jgi:hypothetical protein
MEPNVHEQWENFLNPDVLRPRLLLSSLYITGFEILKVSIVDRIRDFFLCGFDQTGYIISPRYQAEVLSRNRGPLYASLNWLTERVAIEEPDLEAFERIKNCRNRLAHELVSIVSEEGLPSDFEQCFQDMVALLHKIELWWICNVEIPTDPNFDGELIDQEGILPGTVLSLKLLCDVALGDEEQSRYYFEELKKYTSERGS